MPKRVAKKTKRDDFSFKLPVYGVYPAELVMDVDDWSVEVTKINEIASLLWFPKNTSQKEKEAKVALAIRLFNSLKPGDGSEGMLATQMVGTHLAVMDSLLQSENFSAQSPP